MPKLALIQMSSSEDPSQNLKKAGRMIIQAAAEETNIVCLQELFTTRYFCTHPDPAYFSLAESIPGPSTDYLSDLAKQYQMVILAPLFERQAAGVYFNSIAVIDASGELLGVYRKMHIPDDPGFHEKYYFTPGDLGYRVFDTAHGRIGTLICWDQWYPEAARITAMMGAELLVYPTAIATLPEESDQERKKFTEAWQTIQKSHSIANGLFAAAVNRVGEEKGLTFWGRSFISGPFGEILAEAGDGSQILYADLDFSQIEHQRQIWPFFRDRRIESYNPVLKRWIE